MADSENLKVIARLKSVTEVTSADLMQVVRQVYADGVVSRAEAEAVFSLNARLTQVNAHWPDRFVDIIRCFLLEVQAPVGWVTEAETAWLEAQIIREGRDVIDSEIELLLSLLRHAEGAPQALSAFALKVVCDRVRLDGHASAHHVEWLRRVLYAPAGQGAVWVTREEANALWALNDDIGMSANVLAWNDLFSRAIANHLMAFVHPSPDDIAGALAREAWLKDTSSAGISGRFQSMLNSFADGSWFEKIAHDPGKAAIARSAAREAAAARAEAIVPEEKTWFLKRLGWDKRTTPAERALIDFLRAEAPGLVNGIAAAA